MSCLHCAANTRPGSFAILRKIEFGKIWNAPRHLFSEQYRGGRGHNELGTWNIRNSRHSAGQNSSPSILLAANSDFHRDFCCTEHGAQKCSFSLCGCWLKRRCLEAKLSSSPTSLKFTFSSLAHLFTLAILGIESRPWKSLIIARKGRGYYNRFEDFASLRRLSWFLQILRCSSASNSLILSPDVQA